MQVYIQMHMEWKGSPMIMVASNASKLHGKTRQENLHETNLKTRTLNQIGVKLTKTLTDR